jgi:hypothetical protein
LEERWEEARKNARKEEHSKILLENTLTALMELFAWSSDFEERLLLALERRSK